MTIDDETLGRLIDGDLSESERRELERAIEADPDARARLAELRAADEALRAAIRAPETKAGDALRRRILYARRPHGGLASRLAGPAAALVVGVVGAVVGFLMRPLVPDTPSLGLDLALQHTASGGDGPVRVLLSFDSRDGRPCRQFVVRGDEGIACRGRDGWRIVAYSADTWRGANDHYAPASSPDLVDLAAARLGAGEALSVAEERRRIASGWR